MVSYRPCLGSACGADGSLLPFLLVLVPSPKSLFLRSRPASLLFPFLSCFSLLPSPIWRLSRSSLLPFLFSLFALLPVPRPVSSPGFFLPCSDLCSPLFVLPFFLSSRIPLPFSGFLVSLPLYLFPTFRSSICNFLFLRFSKFAPSFSPVSADQSHQTWPSWITDGSCIWDPARSWTLDLASKILDPRPRITDSGSGILDPVSRILAVLDWALLHFWASRAKES